MKKSMALRIGNSTAISSGICQARSATASRSASIHSLISNGTTAPRAA
jgi:hypothetical protein